MKRHVCLALTLTASVLLAVATGYAQSTGWVPRFDVPFDFYVQKTPLPAGEYAVRGHSNGILQIQSTDGKKTVAVIGIPDSPSRKTDVSKLVFNRYGNQYFLSKVSIPSDGALRKLRKSRIETELERAALGVHAQSMVAEKR